VALNLGSAGEQPGASRVAAFLACCLSGLLWHCPCNPYVPKLSHRPRAGFAQGARAKGGKGFSVKQLLHLTVFKINRNGREI
jgi:hypothetical protein